MRKIIHADNSEFFRKQVKIFLNEQALEVESYSTGTEVIEAINKGDVSLLITGLAFADIEGVDFIKRIVGCPYVVPIIILTAVQDPKMEHILNELGIKAHVLKSSAWQEQLLPLLNQLLR
ncbi:MAG: response regulator [Treponema sp.]|jgi:DNA-binding response OmpR family regulator|nr:response regulator [Treponema sp.]